MSPGKLRRIAIVGLSATIVASLLLVGQQRALTALQKENLQQKNRLEQLTAEAQELSNRLVQATFAQSQREDPGSELLRLRGEVGVLRRQFQERGQAMRGKDTAPSEGVPSEQVEQLRTRSQAACERLKAVHDQLQGYGSDPDALLQGILATGIRDTILDSDRSRRQFAAEVLKDSQLKPSDVDFLKGQITDLDKQIKSRLDGFLVGLDALATHIRIMFEDLQRNSADGRLRLVSDLEHAVRSAEELAGRSQ
jgi:small-conductance mechanosensitive channel